jgi:fluoride ion exporter CrcB/FEX
LDGLFPKRGCTLKEEIQCYSLPYGGIGFASHILTYYTFIILACGRSPWQPWRMLDSWKLDLILGLLGLLITMSTSIYTAVRCHNRWQFVLIAVWKLTLSISLTAMSVHVAAVVRKAVKDEKVYYHTSGAPNTVFAGKVTSDKTSDLILWLLAYIPGILVGLPGIISLVVQTWDDHTIRIITYTFLGTWFGLSILGTMIAALVAEDETKTAVSIYLAMIFALLLCMLAPFYSDWTLGAIAGNWAGTPTSDNAVLYWLYFVGKRLPFLSI